MSSSIEQRIIWKNYHAILTWYKSIQHMVACDTTWTNYFHKIRPSPLIRNSCLKNHIYDDNNMTLIQTTTQKGELTQICIVVQWLIPATFHRNDWSRYVFLSVIIDFDHEILWYRNSKTWLVKLYNLHWEPGLSQFPGYGWIMILHFVLGYRLYIHGVRNSLRNAWNLYHCSHWYQMAASLDMAVLCNFKFI